MKNIFRHIGIKKNTASNRVRLNNNIRAPVISNDPINNVNGYEWPKKAHIKSLSGIVLNGLSSKANGVLNCTWKNLQTPNTAISNARIYLNASCQKAVNVDDSGS